MSRAVRSDAGKMFVGTRIVAYVGSVAGLDRELARAGASGSVVVVADEAVIRNGMLERVLRHVVQFKSEVAPGVVTADPVTVESITRHARERGCGAVLIVGGGTALSVGRAVSLLLSNSGTIVSYQGGDRAENAPAPCVAVPTTAGSGSEVSRAIVLHHPDGSPNIVIQGDGYEPRTAVLDGELLMTVPREAALFAALDALSHAFEALWSANPTPVTDCFAVTAAGIVISHLPTAVREPSPKVWQSLLEASTLANLACGNTGIALVHALSSPASPVPHGLLNGLLLPAVARFNYDHVGEQARKCIAQLDLLYDELRFPADFWPTELPTGSFERMRDAAVNHPGTKNNVRQPSASDIEEILDSAGIHRTSTERGNHS